MVEAEALKLEGGAAGATASFSAGGGSRGAGDATGFSAAGAGTAACGLAASSPHEVKRLAMRAKESAWLDFTPSGMPDFSRRCKHEMGIESKDD
jgi:hypothetical protein